MNQATFETRLRAGEAHLRRADPLMRRLIDRHGECGMAPNWKRSPYQALVSAIIGQQLAGRAAAAIHQRFVDLFPGHAFPPPELVAMASDEMLRSAGLSRQKLSYIRDIAAKAVDGDIPVRRAGLARMSDEAIIERFTEARGVGRWTVEMLLMFTLGRLDVLPVDDWGVRSGYTRARRLDEPVAPRELAAIGERWAPYRSVAAWYLWRAADA